ncbi:cytochrome c oxidase assembly factor Coa1 family protein [Aquimarina muelleri]|uniref:cytochrome c oxidase assembly factor Coa1 family protein n=1 Tax=Aquimarina muelleri TaxID=279356 RepID=UPI003F686136
MNELIVNRNWWERNWKWLLPSIGILACISVFFIITGNATHRYVSVLAQPALTNNALEIVKKNNRVVEKLGELSPVDFFLLLEGDVTYSNNNTIVALTVGIRGTKGKAKMDILAHKNGLNWNYQKITVRIKKPIKETIIVLE